MGLTILIPIMNYLYKHINGTGISEANPLKSFDVADTNWKQPENGVLFKFNQWEFVSED